MLPHLFVPSATVAYVQGSLGGAPFKGRSSQYFNKNATRPLAAKHGNGHGICAHTRGGGQRFTRKQT